MLVIGGLVPTVASAQATKRAKFGKAVKLRGFAENMRVRPYRLEVVEPGEFEEPAPGHHYVGVRIRLKNVGRATYSDSPGNGAVLVTRDGEAHDSVILVDGSCETTASLRIPRRQSRRVCIAFEVPVDARPRFFEFTLNSGFADETGQWRRLPRP